jgi:hypothetical protein
MYTTRKGKPGQDRQNRTAEQDRQNRIGITGQNRTGSTGQTGLVR